MSRKVFRTPPYQGATCPDLGAGPEFLAALGEHPPRPIPILADPVDLRDRADHPNQVVDGLAAYLTVILDDAAQNTPGGLDLSDAEAILVDLASDLSGAIQRAAEEMAGRVE